MIAVGVFTVGLVVAVLSGHAMFVLGVRNAWLDGLFFVGVLAVFLVLVRELAKAATVSIVRGWRRDRKHERG